MNGGVCPWDCRSEIRPMTGRRGYMNLTRRSIGSDPALMEITSGL
jgi:hypothetical protein